MKTQRFIVTLFALTLVFAPGLLDTTTADTIRGRYVARLISPRPERFWCRVTFIELNGDPCFLSLIHRYVKRNCASHSTADAPLAGSPASVIH